MPTIRRALGPDVSLLADANSGFSPARAIEVGRLLEAEGVEHFEEPCPYWELEQTKQVADALSVPVTGGEQDCELSTWRLICERRVVDVAQPDVLYLGGIDRTMRVARMAAAHGLPVTPHSANMGLVTLFTMHLLAALPNAGKYLEFSIEEADYYPWQYGLFRTTLSRRGRAGDDLGRAGLGRRDRPGMARPVAVSGERGHMTGTHVPGVTVPSE